MYLEIVAESGATIPQDVIKYQEYEEEESFGYFPNIGIN